MMNCSIDGCDKPAKTRGWCSKHYTRWIRHGNPHTDFTSRRGARTHGEHKTRLYHCWEGMKARCSNPHYVNYHGRGITVCEEWLNYEGFRAWALANGYEDNLEIDRIDFNGNYEPSNCRWVSQSVSSLNRRQPVGSSGFAGVRKQGNKWTARIKFRGKTLHIGGFDTRQEAAAAYDDIAILLWGSYARLNFATRIAGSGEPVN